MNPTATRLPVANDVWTPKGRSRGIVVTVIGVDEHVVLFERSDVPKRERVMNRLSVFIDRFEPLVTAEEQELHRLEAERLRLEIEAAAATDAAAEVPAEKCECETHTGTERINGVRCCERCGKPR